MLHKEPAAGATRVWYPGIVSRLCPVLVYGVLLLLVLYLVSAVSGVSPDAAGVEGLKDEPCHWGAVNLATSY